MKKLITYKRVTCYGLELTIYSFDYSGFPQKAGIGSTKSLLFFLLRTPK